jgi:sodium-dependent dicarboxylate transporter 2/3/5
LDKLPVINDFHLDSGSEIVATKLTYEQRILAIVFTFTVLLWFTAKDVTIGGFSFTGWTNLFPFPGFIKESTVAMFSAFLLFVIPAKNSTGNLLDWEAARKIPFGVIFLFGGGFALAKVIGSSGLSAWLGESLQFVEGYSPFIVIIVLATFMTFFTELTSNTASTVLILPILSVLVQNINIHPLLIMMPVIFSASYAFMLPVATPPNTIVFATEKIKAKEMAQTGLVLNLFGIVCSVAAVLIWAKWVYGL